MGEVYRADDLKLGESVALKFLPRHITEHSEALAGLHQEVRLTRLGETRISPRLSRDGTRLYSIHSDGAGPARLVELDLATKTERDVVELNASGSLAVLPDGRLLVSQAELHRSFRLYEDLYLVDPSGGDLERLTVGARLSEPDVSSDGRVVCVQRLGPGRVALASTRERISRRTARARSATRLFSLIPSPTR